MEFDITKHELVPEHIKLTEEEKKKILEKYNVSARQMPSILKTDPAIQHLVPVSGDLIMVKRKSATAGESAYYRMVKDA